MSLEVLLLVGVVVLAAAVVYLWQRGRQRAADPADAPVAGKRAGPELDTVTAWPPEATRLLTGAERAAHELLLKALPECMVFAQVSLARFIKVPRRHSYTEWLTRVGHLAADLIITDRSTQVIGVVLLQYARETERAERRRSRMTRVLKAAGVKVFVWRELHLPAADVARDQLTQRLGEINTGVPEPELPQRAARPATVGAGKLPVPEVLAEDDDDDDSPRREPPPSTWFDDLDSGRTPLADSRGMPLTDTRGMPLMDSGRMPASDSGRMPLDPPRKPPSR